MRDLSPNLRKDLRTIQRKRYYEMHTLYLFTMKSYSHLGLSWALLGYVRKSFATLGYLRVSQAILSYLGLFLAISGYFVLSQAISGYLLVTRALSWAISVSGYIWCTENFAWQLFLTNQSLETIAKVFA